MHPIQTSSRFRRDAGFTMIELLVSLAVLVVVLLGVLELFDFSSRISRVQTNVTDMQQSLRIAQQDAIRTIRMAGRGPLPLGLPPTGNALSLSDNVAAGTRIGGGGTPLVVAGTDVLAVRGVFESPIYQVNSARPGTFVLEYSSGVPVRGTVFIENLTPTAIPQELEDLRQAVEDEVREPLLLISPRDASIYAVVELDPSRSNVSDPARFQIGFLIEGGVRTTQYLAISRGGAFPAADLTSVAFVGILEEHRFYVREVPGEVAPNGTPEVVSLMSRARVYPGTNSPWGSDKVTDDEHLNWRIEVADNIVDLQVALAFDSPRGGGAITADDDDIGDDDRIFETENGDDDDWLFNDNQPVNPLQWANQQLYFVRLTTLARTDRRDPNYQSPELVRLENHDLTTSVLNSRTDRMFRYRPLQTLIDMRNL